MKKIAIFQSDLNMGGIQRSLISFLKGIDKSKYEIDLYLFEKQNTLIREVPSEVTVIYLKKHMFFSKLLYFNLIYKFKFLFKFKYYDISIDFNGYQAFTAISALAVNAQKKIIWVHSDYYNRRKQSLKFWLMFLLMKPKYKYFDKIVAVSKSAKRSFGTLLPKQKAKTDVIWNLIDANALKNGVRKSEKRELKGNYKVISIGRLVPVKGFDRLIEIAKELTNNGYDIKFYLVGEGPSKKELISLVQQYEIEDAFIFLGQIENPLPLLKQANLFVSTSHYEGLSIALLESLMCGVPIVAPKTSGIVDIYEGIAPNGSMILTDNNVKGLYNGIINAMAGGVSKSFEINLEEYNSMILQKIEKLME